MNNKLIQCINSLEAQGIPAASAAETVGRIKNIAEEVRKNGKTDNVSAEVAKKIMEDAERKRIEAALKKKRARINAIKRNAVSEYIDQAVSEGVSVVDALEAVLAGSHKVFTGSRDSIASRSTALKAKWAGSLLNELDGRNLTKLLLKDKQFSNLAMMEMIEPGSTGNVKASEAAKVFSNMLEYMRTQLNDIAGTNIGKLDNYAPQTHNTLIMRKAGENEWVQFIYDRLDIERTFPDLTQAESIDVLRDIYHTIITGKKNASSPNKTTTYKMPRRVITRFEESRVLHFKDGTSAVEYNDKFGNGNITQAIIDRIEVYSNALALMDRLGYNPELSLENIVIDYKNRLRKEKNDSAYKELEQAWRSDGKLAIYYRILSGEAGTPENITVARIASSIRAITSMSKLGGALLSAFADIGIKSAAARHAGVGWLESWKTGIDMRFKRFSSEEKVQLGRELGLYVDGLIGELYSKFDVSDNLSGNMSRFMNAFFKMSGLTGWAEAHKASYGFALSNRLAMNAGKKFEELNPDYKVVLEKNGMADVWDCLPYMIKEVDGQKYVVPDATDTIPVNILESKKPELTKAAADGSITQEEYLNQLYIIQQDISNRVMTYFADEISYAVLEPDVKTRAVVNRGLKPGTVAGEFFRFAWQFKSFPVTYYQRIMKEGRWRHASKISRGNQTVMSRITDDPLAMIHFFLSTTVLGYVSMTAKDLSRGKEPRNPLKPETMIASMLQGGGLGLLGDFMFGEVNRFGNQHAANIVGPVISEATNFITIFSSLVRGDLEGAGETAITTTMNNMPFVNLWYTRMALDYLIQYRLREYMSPGTLKRSERKMKEKFDQEYLKIGKFDFTPSKNIPRGGF